MMEKTYKFGICLVVLVLGVIIFQLGIVTRHLHDIHVTLKMQKSGNEAIVAEKK